MLLSGIEKKLGGFSLRVEELRIDRPGVYGLIGPNGSGKSTLAKLMAGLLEPDTGTIDTGGLGSRDITFLSGKPYMMDDTVYNNFVYPLRLRNIGPDPKSIAASLEKMGFRGKEKQKARSLSGGEKQKLAFFRALVFAPRLIIADEAMTALDMDSLDLFERTILERQKEDPITWIMISHQMPHVRRLCDYVFFMYGGKIETGGNTGDIFSGASNPRLRQYLRAYDGGSPPDGTQDAG